MASTRPRFSKQTLTDYVQAHINYIQRTWGFDPSNGYAQVEAVARRRFKKLADQYKDVQACVDAGQRAYGEFCEMRQLAQEFDLNVNLTGSEKK